MSLVCHNNANKKHYNQWLIQDLRKRMWALLLVSSSLFFRVLKGFLPLSSGAKPQRTGPLHSGTTGTQNVVFSWLKMHQKFADMNVKL